MYLKKQYKGRIDIEIDVDQILIIPLRKRCNIRSLAAALGVPKTRVHRYVKWGKIKRQSNCLKPTLTTQNKYDRLKWCLSHIVHEANGDNKHNDMYDGVHVDEKWFLLSQVTGKYYLAPRECKPYRTCKSKRFICKVMFLVATAKPRFNEDGFCPFDRKIGL